MALIKDFWRVWGLFQDAKLEENQIKEIAINEPRYISAYASAKAALLRAEEDLVEVVNSLRMDGLLTDDMKAMMDDRPLNSIYPDANGMADFWASSPQDDRLILMLRLGIMKSIAEQYLSKTYASLPEGFRQKMEGIHNG